MRSGTRGFTLVEIMIVVAIIAILAAIALPEYRKAVNDSRISACISEGGAYVKNRSAAVYGNVDPLITYTPNACAGGANLEPATPNDLTGSATFTARDTAATTITCDWSATPCSAN